MGVEGCEDLHHLRLVGRTDLRADPLLTQVQAHEDGGAVECDPLGKASVNRSHAEHQIPQSVDGRIVQAWPAPFRLLGRLSCRGLWGAATHECLVISFRPGFQR